MATEAGSYEGGAGGVFRRRSSRNRSTPYDRPPTGRHALRNPIEAVAATTRATGWFSKLKDPLSRIVHNSYTRFFSLGSRKRLGPPAANSEPLPGSRDESPNEVSNILFSGVQEGGSEGGRRSNCSESIGLDELEQLLRQKTFTRFEIDRLTELLRSRTVDFSPDDENRKFAPNSSVPAATSDVPPQENGTNVQSNGLLGSISTPAVHSNVAVPEEVASAAEIAKAYMGTSRVSPSTLGLRSQAFREDAPFQNNVPYAPKSPSLALSPRPGIRFSSVPRLSKDAYLTSKSKGGRSVIHNMARSPYARPVQAMAFPEGIAVDGYTGPSTSSQRPQANGVLSSGRQALKRRSSFMDDDFGSIGPIRRIRQKSNMMARRASILTSPISSDACPSSSSPTQQLLQLDGPKENGSHIKAAENGDHRIANSGFTSVPSQSSEMARKILEQLDMMVPSPKEKSTVSKLALAMEKSPAKLTLDMLQGPARRSMEDIDSPNFHNVQGGVFDGHSGSTFLIPESSIAREEDRVVENGVSEPADGGKMASKDNGLGNAIITTTYIPFVKAVDSVSVGHPTNPPSSKRPFQMSAPEDFLEDDDNYCSKDISTSQNEKLELYQSENKAVSPDMMVQKPPVSFSEAKLAEKSSLRTGSVKKSSIGLIIAEKDFSGFTFPVTSASDALSEPPTPTPLLSPVFGIPLQPKDQTGTPLFSFGSTSISKTSAIPASSTTSSANETSGFKFGAASDSKAEIKDSDATAFLNTPSILPASPPVTALASPPSTLPATSLASPLAAAAAATPLAITGSDKIDQLQKSGDSLFSQNASSSSSSTSTSLSIFSGVSASTTTTIANGLMASTSSTVAVSSAPVAPVSSSSTKTFFQGISSSSSSPSISAAAAAVPAALPFQFGSASAVPTLANSFSLPSTTAAQEQSDLATKDKPDKASPFGIINSSFPAISSGQFTSTGSSIFGSSTPYLSNKNASSTTGNTATGNQSQSPVSPFGAIAGSLFSSQTSAAGTAVSSFTQSATGQFGSSSSSPSFGLSGSSVFGSSSSPFGSSISGSKPFGLSSSFGSTSSVSFSTGSGTSPFGTSSNPFSSSSQSSAPSFFTSGFGSTSTLATGFSFGGSSAAGSVSFGVPSTAGNVSFGGSSAAGFSFGPSLSASSGPAFPFTSAASAATLGTPPASFGSTSPGNDQMNIEDSMAEDTVQAPATVVPSFGMAASSPLPSNFVFGSPSVPVGGSLPFQFGAPQNPGAPQAPSPFTPAGNLEFNGGSFSLGSGGGDKSNRRIVKVKRDKGRRK